MISCSTTSTSHPCSRNHFILASSAGNENIFRKRKHGYSSARKLHRPDDASRTSELYLSGYVWCRSVRPQDDLSTILLLPSRFSNTKTAHSSKSRTTMATRSATTKTSARGLHALLQMSESSSQKILLHVPIELPNRQYSGVPWTSIQRLYSTRLQGWIL